MAICQLPALIGSIQIHMITSLFRMPDCGRYHSWSNSKKSCRMHPNLSAAMSYLGQIDTHLVSD